MRFLLLFFFILLTGCGFHLQGQMQLAPPFHRMYLQTNDPYNALARSLRQNLKLSNVRLVSSRTEADIIMVIQQDEVSQQLISVSGTQQTRLYLLTARADFSLVRPNGETILNTQSFTEQRTIFTQSNQVLGSSNEVNMLYQQMRRALSLAILNRLGSKEVTRLVMNAYSAN